MAATRARSCLRVGLAILCGMIVDRGIGSRIWDIDGNEYVDYLIGSGPMLLGHGHPEGWGRS